MSRPDYLEMKWRIGFKFLDVNKDGVLTPEDYSVVPDYVQKATNASDAEMKTFRDYWNNWFELLNDHSDTRRISVEKFVQQCRRVYTDDEEGTRELSRVSYSELFDVLDANHDGKISTEELEVYYEAHGVYNKTFVERVFAELDTDYDGSISREELTQAGVEYWWNPTPNGRYSVIYDPEGASLGNTGCKVQL